MSPVLIDTYISHEIELFTKPSRPFLSYVKVGCATPEGHKEQINSLTTSRHWWCQDLYSLVKSLKMYKNPACMVSETDIGIGEEAIDRG